MQLYKQAYTRLGETCEVRLNARWAVWPFNVPLAPPLLYLLQRLRGRTYCLRGPRVSVCGWEGKPTVGHKYANGIG